MTDVVDRPDQAVVEESFVRSSEARRVLLILSLFMLVALLANFWF
jgi:hypothetical protein